MQYRQGPGETDEEFLCRVDPEFALIVERNRALHEEQRRLMSKRQAPAQPDGHAPPIAASAGADPECYYCRGTGKRECNLCDGRGRYQDRRGELVRCEKCRGSGSIPCHCLR